MTARGVVAVIPQRGVGRLGLQLGLAGQQAVEAQIALGFGQPAFGLFQLSREIPGYLGRTALRRRHGTT